MPVKPSAAPVAERRQNRINRVLLYSAGSLLVLLGLAMTAMRTSPVHVELGPLATRGLGLSIAALGGAAFGAAKSNYRGGWWTFGGTVLVWSVLAFLLAGLDRVVAGQKIPWRDVATATIAALVGLTFLLRGHEAHQSRSRASPGEPAGRLHP